MTFQDMVSATNGVLNYVADELNEKTVTILEFWWI